MALELSFLRANVRLLADELADLNGSVDVYQHCDGDDSHSEGSVDRDNRHCCSCRRVATNIADRSVIRNRRRQNLQQQMPMIAVPLKDTRPIDFRPPLEVSCGDGMSQTKKKLFDDMAGLTKLY